MNKYLAILTVVLFSTASSAQSPKKIIHSQISSKVSLNKKNSNTVIDVDGNTYHTVKIGTQTWMAEDLKTTRYRNGDLIGTNSTNCSYWDVNTPKLQWSHNADNRIVSNYGRLYTWHVVNDSRNIAPKGWHVPTDDEWTTLVNYLINNGYNIDGTTTSNKIAKSLASTILWKKASNSGKAIGNELTMNNNTGFTALPGGLRDVSGGFSYIGEEGRWWSATEASAKTAWYRVMNTNQTYFSRMSNSDKSYGFSVRCIKGESAKANSNNAVVVKQTETAKDVDGNVYSTVRIGSQVWMAENLRTTKYNDGSSISNVTDKFGWKELTTDAYCTYENTTNESFITTDGRLYNLFALNSGKLCPTGWHIPTDNDWLSLLKYFNIGQSPQDIDELTRSEFNARPGGYRRENGDFDHNSNGGIWWSSSQKLFFYINRRGLGYYDIGLTRNENTKGFGCHIRCIKD